jgi:hypothetical protein
LPTLLLQHLKPRLNLNGIKPPQKTATTTNEKLRPVKRPQLFYPAKSDFDFYLLPITG